MNYAIKQAEKREKEVSTCKHKLEETIIKAEAVSKMPAVAYKRKDDLTEEQA